MLAGKYENFDSIVYLEDQKTYFKSTAVLKIMFHLGGIWTVLSIMLSVFPLFIRDYVYDKVAANRYKIFGKKDTCRIPTPTEKESFLE